MTRSFTRCTNWTSGLVAGHKAAAAVVMAVLGVSLGLWLNHSSHSPHTLDQIIRALQKQDNVFHDVWQVVWACLPDWATKRCATLQPCSAAEIRRLAANELAGLGPKAERAVPYLTKALEDPDQGVGLAAIAALEAVGPRAKPALPALLNSFTDPAHDVLQFQRQRTQLAAVLVAIAPDDARVQAALLDTGMRHRDPELRAHSLEALAMIKPTSEQIIQALIDSLRSPEARVRAAAVTAVGEIGTGASNAVPALVSVYEKVAQAVLVQRHPGVAPSVPVPSDWPGGRSPYRGSIE